MNQIVLALDANSEQWPFIHKIREKQAECGKYTDAKMERIYQKLVKLPVKKLEEISKMSLADRMRAGY